MKELAKVSRFFGAMGNPRRLSILLTLLDSRKPLHIKAISRLLELDYAAAYRHVKILEASGLVEIFEVGRSRVLSPIDPQGIRDMLERGRKRVVESPERTS